MLVGKSAANAGGQDTKATSHIDSSQVETSSGVTEPDDEWCEATTPEGYVYYWNTVTKGEHIAVISFTHSHTLSAFVTSVFQCILWKRNPVRAVGL